MRACKTDGPGAVADLRFSFKEGVCRRSKQVVGFGEILVIFMWVLGAYPRFHVDFRSGSKILVWVSEVNPGPTGATVPKACM